MGSGVWGVSVDRRLSGGARDLDLAGVHLLRLRDVDLVGAFLVGRLDRVLGDTLREPDRAGEGAEAALEAVVALLRDLRAPLALGADRQRAVLDLDRDLVLGHAGKVEREDELRVGLPGVER